MPIRVCGGLRASAPTFAEAREAASRIVKDATRAAEIISRTRLLFKKGAAQRELVGVNEMVREMIVLLRGEATRHSILVRTDLAADLPQILGDRVQLQQVLMNLMLNGMEAMKDVDGRRELLIKSQRTENEEVIVSVSDTGVGLPVQHADQIFQGFLYDEGSGDRDGTLDQPFDCGIAWWTVVGRRQLAARGQLLFHVVD